MITTKRTYLRAIQLKDCNDVFAYRSNAEVNQYQSWIPKWGKGILGWHRPNPVFGTEVLGDQSSLKL